MDEAPPTPAGTPSAAWANAVRIAGSCPDGREALTGVLAETVAGADAVAGAVLDRRGPGCRAAWGVEPESILPMARDGGAVQEAMARQEDWSQDALLLERGLCAGVWSVEPEKMLLIPLRARGFVVGGLALLYPARATPGVGERDAAASFAGLLALIVEQERLFEEAHEARRAHDHFVIALSHELRTPATALMLDAELLRTGAFGELPARLEKVLRETELHVQELTEVLRRVIDLGTGGAVAPERADLLQPRHLVAELLRRVEPAAKRKGLSLSLYVPRNLPALQTDVARVARILLHLFSNAVKFTANGRVEVRLERATLVLARHRPEPVLRIRVRDTGCGIPPEQLSRIFEPFAQVDEGARTDSRSRGVGLGLPLAQQLARSLGGDVTLESAPGAGTTATLTLPYRQPPTG